MSHPDIMSQWDNATFQKCIYLKSQKIVFVIIIAKTAGTIHHDTPAFVAQNNYVSLG